MTLMGMVSFSQPYNKGTVSVGIGGELLFANRNLKNTHNTGFGGTIKGEYVFAKHATATVASGYYFLGAKKSNIVATENVSAIPLKAGIRYYLGSFYASGEAGAIFLSRYGAGTSFLWSFGIGDKFTLKRRVYDIGVRHESWPSESKGNASVVALRMAYEFSVNQNTSSKRAAF